MAWTFVDQRIGMQPITTVDTTKNHQLGTRAWAEDPTNGMAEFIYLPGATNVTTGAWVTIAQDDHSVAALAADAIGPVAVAMSDLDATTDYGWYMIYGKVSSAQCLTSFADNGLVFATASVGFVDDASVAGDLVNRARGASASTARAADFELHYPFVNNNSNSGA